MIKDFGTHIATDGCRMRWILSKTPQTVWYTNPKGSLENSISGKIDHKRLEHLLKAFIRTHDWVQESLF